MSDLSALSDDDLLSQIHSDLGATQTAAQQAPGTSQPDQTAAPPATSTQSQPHSFWRKLTFGMGDVPLALNQSFDRTLPDNYKPFSNIPALAGNQLFTRPKDADARVAERENLWQTERANTGDTGMEWVRGLGNVVASAPIAAEIPGASTGAGFWPKLFTSMGQGAVLNPLVSPVTDPDQDFAKAKLGQAVGGAATGGLFDIGQHLFGKALSPTVDSALSYLRDRGVQPTVGQNLGTAAAKAEDIFGTAHPAIQFGQQRALKQFNVAAYNEALKAAAPALDESAAQYSGPAGRAGIKYVGDTLDSAFDNLKGQISLPVTDTLRNNIGQVISEASAPDPAIGKSILGILDKDLYSKIDDNGTLSGDAFKSAEGQLTRYARQYAGSPDANQKQVGKGLFDVVDHLRTALATANPDQAAKLQALNKGWAMLTRIEDAPISSNANGIFTPQQLARSVESGDQSVRHRAYVRGEALLQPLSDAGLKVLGEKYPNSGSITRAIMAAPEVLGGTAYLVHPGAAAGMAASSLAYTPWGQRLAGAAINDRPAIVRKAGNLLLGQEGGLSRYALPNLLGLSRPAPVLFSGEEPPAP